MFKINIYLKFALIAIGFLGGIALWVAFGFWYGIWFLLAGLVFLASYLLLGTIQSSAELLEMQDFAGAEKQLSLTFFPKLLYVTNRAIYYALKGTIETQKGNKGEAERLLNTALEMNLPSDNEKAIVLLQLANLNVMKSNWAGAKIQINQLKKMKISEPMLKDQIEQFDRAIENRGQANIAKSMGKQGFQMIQGGYGSKRKRPKMR